MFLRGETTKNPICKYDDCECESIMRGRAVRLTGIMRGVRAPARRAVSFRFSIVRVGAHSPRALFPSRTNHGKSPPPPSAFSICSLLFPRYPAAALSLSSRSRGGRSPTPSPPCRSSRLLTSPNGNMRGVAYFFLGRPRGSVKASRLGVAFFFTLRFIVGAKLWVYPGGDGAGCVRREKCKLHGRLSVGSSGVRISEIEK